MAVKRLRNAQWVERNKFDKKKNETE
jgi:hypothetical protein